MTSAGLWMPGTKTISIPSGKVFGNEYGINSTFRMLDEHTIEYIGAEDKVVSMTEFYDWLKQYAAKTLRGPRQQSDMVVSLGSGYRMRNPEHLTDGTLEQDAQGEGSIRLLRETWMSIGDMSGSDLFTDKVYIQDYTAPRERKTLLDNGHRGFR